MSAPLTKIPPISSGIRHAVVDSVIVGMLLYSEPTDPIRTVCLMLIVAGMVRLDLDF